MFKIVSEASVAAGVRRIEALTGRKFLELFEERQKTLNDTAAALKTTPTDLVQRADQVVEEIRGLTRNVDSLNSKIAEMKLSELLNAAEDVNGVSVIAAKLDDTPEVMRSIGDILKERNANGVAVLATVTGESKIQLLCGCCQGWCTRWQNHQGSCEAVRRWRRRPSGLCIRRRQEAGEAGRGTADSLFCGCRYC